MVRGTPWKQLDMGMGNYLFQVYKRKSIFPTKVVIMSWQLARHKMINHRFLNIQINDVVAIEHGWVKTFAILPRQTISNKWVWMTSIFARRVWVYTGFIDEPETQYGDLFDIIKS